MLGELYVDTLYTVPGESSDAGKRIFTNSDNTKMLIEGNDVPISEDYRTHWFDTGIVKNVSVYTVKDITGEQYHSSTNLNLYSTYDFGKTLITIDKSRYNYGHVHDYEIVNTNYRNISHFVRKLTYNHGSIDGNVATELRGDYTNGAHFVAKRGVSSVGLIP